MPTLLEKAAIVHTGAMDAFLNQEVRVFVESLSVLCVLAPARSLRLVNSSIARLAP